MNAQFLEWNEIRKQFVAEVKLSSDAAAVVFVRDGYCN